MWVDNRDDAQVGQIVFVIRTLNTSSASERRVGSLRPARKNMSHEPILDGWAGETNNISCYAEGCGRIVRVAGELGERALVRMLCGEALVSALDSAGYPELATKP